jgi:hypothetical protein
MLDAVNTAEIQAGFAFTVFSRHNFATNLIYFKDSVLGVILWDCFHRVTMTGRGKPEAWG